MKDIDKRLRILNDKGLSLRSELLKIYKSTQNAITECIGNEWDIPKNYCEKAENLLTAISYVNFSTQQVNRLFKNNLQMIFM